MAAVRSLLWSKGTSLSLTRRPETIAVTGSAHAGAWLIFEALDIRRGVRIGIRSRRRWPGVRQGPCSSAADCEILSSVSVEL